jgi:hypothetical protein
VNLFLVLASLALEVIGLFRRPANRFARIVGIIGLILLSWAYFSVTFINNSEMPTAFLRPGFMLFFAYNIARELYEHFRI